MSDNRINKNVQKVKHKFTAKFISYMLTEKFNMVKLVLKDLQDDTEMWLDGTPIDACEFSEDIDNLRFKDRIIFEAEVAEDPETEFKLTNIVNIRKV